MGTEDFSRVRQAVAPDNDNIKLVSQAWGDPVSQFGLVGNGGGDIQPAGLFSTAPYIPPKAGCPGLDGKPCGSTKLIRAHTGLCASCHTTKIWRERAAAED